MPNSYCMQVKVSIALHTHTSVLLICTCECDRVTENNRNAPESARGAPFNKNAIRYACRYLRASRNETRDKSLIHAHDR